MKTLTLFLILLSGLATGQGFIRYVPGATPEGEPGMLKWVYPSFNEVITDSIVWRLQSVDNPGDSTCVHEWVYGPESPAKPFTSCLVYHNGFHCDYNDMVRSQICKLCLRKEIWREQWYQHRNEPPKSEYELLEEKISGKVRKPTMYFNNTDTIVFGLPDTLWFNDTIYFKP